MIVDERLVTYINSLDTGNTRILDAVEREALDSYVPIIRKEMQSFLKFLLAMKKPARILEVGTAVGFSAILMAEYDPVPCQITTIENYEKRIPIARENFKRAGKEAQIALLEGDAAEVLKTLEGPYDFIFMDAAKGQYIHFLPEILRLLAKGWGINQIAALLKKSNKTISAQKNSAMRRLSLRSNAEMYAWINSAQGMQELNINSAYGEQMEWKKIVQPAMSPS